jgi:hypothetical protein
MQGEQASVPFVARVPSVADNAIQFEITLVHACTRFTKNIFLVPEQLYDDTRAPRYLSTTRALSSNNPGRSQRYRPFK